MKAVIGGEEPLQQISAQRGFAALLQELSENKCYKMAQEF